MFFFSTIKNSLLIKWVLTAVSIVIIVFALLIPSTLSLLNSVTEARLNNYNGGLAVLINSAVAPALFSRNPALANETLSRLFSQTDQNLNYIFVYDHEGNLFAQAGSVNPDLLPIEDNNLTQALQDGIYDTHSILKLNGEIIGSVRYGYYLSNELDVSNKLRRRGIIIIVSTILATATLFSLLGLILTRQLKKLIVGTHAIVAGDYTNKVKVSSQDEIGQLSRDFNSMIDAIREKTDMIEESKRFLQGVTDNIEGMIYRCSNNQQRMLRYVSAGAEKLTGYDPEALVTDGGFGCSCLIFAEDRERVRTEIQQACRDGQRFSITYRIQTRTGEIKWVLDRGGQMANDESLIEGILIDATAQKQAEIEQKKAEHQSTQYLGQLAQLHRVNTLGEMTAGIAHEINQPLTSIATRSDAARRRLAAKQPDIAKIDSALVAISEQALRAGRVMRQMSDLVSVHLSERELVDPNELLEEAQKIARIDGTLIGTRIKSEFSPYLLPVLVDKIQIQQVILNLLRNAQDAMQSLPPNERMIVLKSTRLDAFVQISVIDKGSGIDLDTESQLLNAFFTTKKNGMGMGLSICRTIITAHAGQLWFSRNEKQGVSFHVTLPTGRENKVTMEITDD